MNYSEFDVEDLASDDSFIAWVLSPDQESSAFWERFQREHPQFRFRVQKARELVLNIRLAEASDSGSKPAELWSRIERQLTNVPDSREQRGRLPLWLKVAASISIAVLAAIGVYVLPDYFPGQTATVNSAGQPHFIEELNTTGSLLKIHLSDGSTVTLEDKSRLRYPESFASSSTREVYLTGEALFEIAKNVKQPFMVHTGEISTKVLGTSFRIRAFADDQNIVVAVKEGKVSVFSSSEGRDRSKDREEEVNGVVLTPNQQVTYSRADDSFNKTLVEEPQFVSSQRKDFDFTFENAPVKEVFSLLEEAYGVEIIFDDEVMEHCYLTVPLGDEPLYEKLRIICRTIGASYEVIDASVVISSKGCDRL